MKEPEQILPGNMLVFVDEEVTAKVSILMDREKELELLKTHLLQSASPTTRLILSSRQLVSYPFL